MYAVDNFHLQFFIDMKNCSFLKFIFRIQSEHHILINKMIYKINDDMINIILLLNKEYSTISYNIISNQNEIFCF